MSMKIKVTKKQKRIMNKLLLALDKRQRQYVEENSRLFPGASNLPFMFIASIRISPFGESVSIECHILYSKVLPLHFNIRLPKAKEPYEISVEELWTELHNSLLENWRFMHDDISDESVYLPLIKKV